jgi:Mn-dependent DtxR family transcriptional regulator
MSRYGRTPDEKYIICLFEAVQQAGDIDTLFNRYEIGGLAGINPKGVNAICKLLIQANFIKKRGEEEIVLTPNGQKLAERLLEEK